MNFMVYNYNAFIKDFSNRTIINYNSLLGIARDDEKTKPFNIIEKEDNAEKCYLTTQLINSMLGLLILPQQIFMDDTDILCPPKLKGEEKKRFYQQNRKKRVSRLNETDEYNAIKEELERLYSNKCIFCDYNDNNQVLDVLELLRHMRNAVAHASHGLWFEVSDKNGKQNQINAIYFYDIEDKAKQGNKPGEFCLKVNKEELMELLNNVSLMLAKIEIKYNSDEDRKHNARINMMEDLMKNDFNRNIKDRKTKIEE